MKPEQSFPEHRKQQKVKAVAAEVVAAETMEDPWI
jgi:hypothetical protein